MMWGRGRVIAERGKLREREGSEREMLLALRRVLDARAPERTGPTLDSVRTRCARAIAAALLTIAHLALIQLWIFCVIEFSETLLFPLSSIQPSYVCTLLAAEKGKKEREEQPRR